MKRKPEDILFDGMNMVIMLIVFLITLYPIIYVLSMSVSNPIFVLRREILLFPKGFSLDSYEFLFRNGDIILYYGNTVFYTVVGTTASVILTVMAGFVLSQRSFSGRNIIMFFITFTMFFSGGMIPLFILINNLGMYNTRWALIIPGVVVPFNIIIARTFFQSIPASLFESAHIDGANDIRILADIVIPLSAPIIAVLALFYAVARWNSYFDAMLYTPNKMLHPLQLYLVRLLIENTSESTAVLNHPGINTKGLTSLQLKYSAIIASILPIICVYPFLQKYFVKGVMIGAIKG